MRLAARGLPLPPAFVLGTEVCRDYLRRGETALAGLPEILDRELQTFRRLLPDMLKEHRGEFVLTQEDAAVGFFPTEEEAVREGDRRFLPKPFLVRQVQEKEPVAPLRPGFRCRG